MNLAGDDASSNEAAGESGLAGIDALRRRAVQRGAEPEGSPAYKPLGFAAPERAQSSSEGSGAIEPETLGWARRQARDIWRRSADERTDWVEGPAVASRGPVRLNTHVTLLGL